MSSINDLVLFYFVDSSSNYKNKATLELLQAYVIMAYFGVTPKAVRAGKTRSGCPAQSL